MLVKMKLVFIYYFCKKIVLEIIASASGSDHCVGCKIIRVHLCPSSDIFLLINLFEILGTRHDSEF